MSKSKNMKGSAIQDIIYELDELHPFKDKNFGSNFEKVESDAKSLAYQILETGNEEILRHILGKTSDCNVRSVLSLPAPENVYELASYQPQNILPKP